MNQPGYRAAVIALVLMSLAATGGPPIVHAAECNGASLDGQPIAANAYSFRSSNWYQVHVVFQDQFALIQFDDETNVIVQLNDPVIADARLIMGVEQTPDPELGVATSWQLDLGAC